jgi:hypothetical protein
MIPNSLWLSSVRFFNLENINSLSILFLFRDKKSA